MYKKFNNMFEVEDLPKPLEDSEQLKYLKEAKYSIEARNKVMIHNLRLITTSAYMYAKKFNCELDELQALGIEVLEICIRGYRTDSNASFKTYLITSINRHFQRYIEKRKKMNNTMFSINTTDTDIFDSYNHEYELTTQNDDRLIDMDINLTDDYIEKEMICEIKKMIKELPVEDRKILSLRLGFEGEAKTFKELSNTLGMNISTVTNRYYNIIKSLKNRYYMNLLDKYADLFYITVANIIIFGKNNDSMEKIYYNLDKAKTVFSILDNMSNRNKDFIKEYLKIYDNCYHKDLLTKYNMKSYLELNEYYNILMSSILNKYVEMTQDEKIRTKS